jgi:hypothetical protein
MIRRFMILTLAFFLVAGLAACGDDDDGGRQADVPPPTAPDDEDEATTTTEADEEEDEDEDAEPGDSAVEEFEAEVTEDADEYSDFQQITDDSGQLVIEVPEEYDDVETGASANNDPQIIASPDLEADIEETPVIGYVGIQNDNAQSFSSDNLDEVIEGAASEQADDCEAQEPQDYSDPAFTGRIQVFVDCGGEDRAFLFVAALPDSGDPFVALVFGHAVTVADVDAFQNALDTFNVV